MGRMARTRLNRSWLRKKSLLREWQHCFCKKSLTREQLSALAMWGSERDQRAKRRRGEQNKSIHVGALEDGGASQCARGKFMLSGDFTVQINEPAFVWAKSMLTTLLL